MADTIAMASRRSESSGGLAMLDVIVLIAMAVTVAAFAVGLVLHSGIAQIPALIAAAALYMVMAASYLMVARTSRPTAGGDRLSELEEALEVIDKDLQRIDRVEDDVSRLDLLADRVERLDQAMSDYGVNERPGGLGRFDQFAQEFEEVHAKIENVRADLEGEARNQREKITGDLRILEGLIKQLSHELMAASAAEPAIVAPARPAPVTSRVPDPVVEKIEFEEEEEPEAEAAAATLTVLDIEEEEILVVEEEVFARKEDTPLKEDVPLNEDKPLAEDLAEPAVAEPVDDVKMLEVVSQAIEAGRVDLYLQPTVTLPERRPRYFEALTRIRTKADNIILPGSYLHVAETSGMMPLIDNVLLVKSVQTLRRLGADSRIKGVFCNISVTTLLDPEFFPELVEFMEENSGLSESLVFEVSQPAILGLSTDELGALDTLGALGYGFSLDHVADLDVDFASLRDRSFRFVKIDAKTFLHDLEAKGSAFSASEMKRALDDFDMKLIVEKVEDESQVAKLLDYGVELAQGYLFGRPKPMSPALFREIEDADAA
ncbi:MAG: EAL domain-containing protein [Methyloceanibacter sp.]|nr:EAL domain-containing protein [Methyloceanibacter sp.]